MKKTIKFRGKREDNGEWVYGSLLGQTEIVVDYDTVKNISNDPPYNYLLKAERYIVKQNTIGQFAGRSDYYSKEIYEGDLVENEHGVMGAVKSINGALCVDYGGGTVSSDIFSNSERYVVIMNAHDLSDLSKILLPDED